MDGVSGKEELDEAHESKRDKGVDGGRLGEERNSQKNMYGENQVNWTESVHGRVEKIGQTR